MKENTATKSESVPQGNAFENLIRKHRQGLVAAKASEKLAEAIEMARERGAMSTLTVKLKFKPQNDDQMLIEADVTSTLPKETLPSGMMYVDDENMLHTSDPRQKELDLKTVEKPAELKEAPRKEVKEA